jgi:hypothetical protein
LGEGELDPKTRTFPYLKDFFKKFEEESKGSKIDIVKMAVY